MTNIGKNGKKINRIYWMDNLRSFMVFLVLILHAAIIYEKNSMGTSWWIVVDPSKNDFYGLLFIILNIFVMPTIFFISGFFTPMSLNRNRSLYFIKKKFKRLIIPWAFAVLILLPLYKIIFLNSRGLQQENWISYLYWKNGFSQNWLWYLPALFLFQVLYLLISKINRPKFSFKISVLVTVLLSILYNFCIRYFGFDGWTKTFLIDFENDRLIVYFLIFLLGTKSYTAEIFNKRIIKSRTDLVINCVGWIPINLYIFHLIYLLIRPNHYLISRPIDLFIFRTNFILSMSYIVYAATTTFFKFLNINNSILRVFNNNSYYVYIIHVIVMGAIAMQLKKIEIPYILKFILLIIGTYLLCNFCISIFRWIFRIILSKNNRSDRYE